MSTIHAKDLIYQVDISSVITLEGVVVPVKIL
jgi:hypothetical protein